MSRYLLESGAPDGYLLEDGSGVLLIDYPPITGILGGSGTNVAFRASAVPSGNPTTSFTVTIPAEIETGDVLFLAFNGPGAPSPTVTDNDSGGNSWTEIAQVDDTSTPAKAFLYYKRATSGTASKTITVDGGGTAYSGVLMGFSGSTSSEPPYANIAEDFNDSATKETPGIDPTTDNSMVCVSIGTNENDDSISAISSANFGTITFVQKLATTGCATVMGRDDDPISTATGTISWTQPNNRTLIFVWSIAPGDPPPNVGGVTLSATGAGEAAETLIFNPVSVYLPILVR